MFKQVYILVFDIVQGNGHANKIVRIRDLYLTK